MRLRLKKYRARGLTFLEIIVVVGLIGVVATAAIQKGYGTPRSVSLISMAEQSQYALASAVVAAKSAQATAKVLCDATGVNVDFFKSTGAASRRSNAVGYSLDAAARTAQVTPSWRQTILRSVSSVTITCPACGDVYITSDGSILGSLQCSELSYILTQNSTTDGYLSQSKFKMNWTGFGEIYARQVQTSDQNYPWIPVFR